MYHWTLKPFSALSTEELYAALRLRARVFVVEQNCLFLDPDDKDQDCYHLLGWAGQPHTGPGETPFLAAYVRIVPPGIFYPEPSIGRVVTAPEVRGLGAGKALMKEAIGQLYALFGEQPIRIGAQQYLERFYGSLGFVQTGEMYLEDDIPHIEMTKK